MVSYCNHKNDKRNCKICLPFTCEKCNKVFSKKSYNRHIISCKPKDNLRSICEHLKEFRNCKICTPHTCEKCNKVFSKNSYNSHDKNCVGLKISKSYICSRCPDSNFRDSWCLKRHYKGSPKKHKELLTEYEYKIALEYCNKRISDFILKTLPALPRITN